MVDPISSVPVLSAEDIADMETYGITKQSFDYFFHGEYRYTSFHDALAQAKRMAGKP